MKTATLIIITAVCLASFGCSTHTTVSYHAAMRVAPSEQPGCYDVTAKVVRQTVIRKSSPFWGGTSRHTDVVGAPVLTCEVGNGADCQIETADGASCVLTVEIPARADGKETTCLLEMKSGREVLSSTYVTLPPLER